MSKEKIIQAAKELLAAFPEKIPTKEDKVDFDIPAYLVENLSVAIKQEDCDHLTISDEGLCQQCGVCINSVVNANTVTTIKNILSGLDADLFVATAEMVQQDDGGVTSMQVKLCKPIYLTSEI